MRRPLYRRIAIGVGAVAGVSILAVLALWWRLASGPIALDLATPWLAAAIAENFGNQHGVEVGGTQIERDESGRTTLRLRDIVVRDRDGSIVARAPKAEVGISGSALLTGGLRAERLRLVGAELSVRIEANGQINVFAGADHRPIAAAAPKVLKPSPAPGTQTVPGASVPDASIPLEYGVEGFAALLAWIDGLGESGLDGHDLSELGLIDGTLTVDDRREGKRWSFQNIDVSLRRQHGGAIEFAVRSEQTNKQWVIKATATPNRGGRRSMRLQATQVPAKALLLALRFADLPFDADLPLSARMRVEMGPVGIPDVIEGTILAQSGFIGRIHDPERRVAIEHAAINFQWNPTRRMLMVPMKVVASGNRFTLLAQVIPPLYQGALWRVQLGGGSVVLAAGEKAGAPLVLNRVLVRFNYDPTSRQFDLAHGELGNAETGVAFSGKIDNVGEPRLTLGIASRPMSIATLKKLWPVMIAPKVRHWVIERVSQGTIDSLDIAINSPLVSVVDPERRFSEDGLLIGVVGHGMDLRPVPDLPEVRGADVNVRVTGRTANVRLSQGSVVLPSGRKLTVPDAVFAIANTVPRVPRSETRMQIAGPVAAAAELLGMGPLKGVSGTPLDLASSRGNVQARVTVGVPIMPNPPANMTNYAADVELVNFAAERMIMGHRLDAASLRVRADDTGYTVQGDVKIAGLPATIQFGKQSDEIDSQLRLQTILDDKGRSRVGISLGKTLTGPLPIKLSGRLGADNSESRFSVEADLTQARVDNLLPGWEKAPGKPARAYFTLVKQAATTRFEDLSLDGAGIAVRGDVAFDESWDVISADFPVFSLSPGDKSTLKAERRNTGVLHAVLHGDVYDGRHFLKATTLGSSTDEGETKGQSRDLDLDVKLGAVAGFYGETLRSVALKLVRRNGQIRDFSLNARIGRNSTLIGDYRSQRPGRREIFLETNDAGALLRFTNTYSRVIGGYLVMTMEPPRSDRAPQNGILNVSNFAVRGEAALDRIVSGAPSDRQSGVIFSSLQVGFTRSPGRLSVRDGVVRGPVIGATIDGVIDYRADSVHATGVLVPLYGVNNLFGQLPIVGFFLGGGNKEGLVGINYQVVGSPSAPQFLVNPISVVAPGIIRKFIPNLFNLPTAQQPGAGFPPAYSDTSRQ